MTNNRLNNRQLKQWSPSKGKVTLSLHAHPSFPSLPPSPPFPLSKQEHYFLMHSCVLEADFSSKQVLRVDAKTVTATSICFGIGM
jgi:hypothetical protein